MVPLGPASPVRRTEVTNMHTDTDTDTLCLETAVARLEAAAGYRVLQAVPEIFTDMPGGAPPEGRCIGIVDVETSGLDVDEHHLIELALMLVWVDDAGSVVGHLGPVSWLEDPKVPLDPHIVRLTGLTNADLWGHEIDDKMVSSLLDRADLLVAHNAQFDLAWIEQRYPALAGRPWACSCRDIDWPALGFEGRGQQPLLWQHGFFAKAHRAGDDVWSLFRILTQRRADPDGNADQGPERTHLARLIEAADAPTFMVEALHAPYSAKDRLKARGYRWNAKAKVWARELHEDALAAERSWFREQGLPPFVTRPMTACERHR
jgi:DNA polymerase III subunit epsilon